MDKVQVLDTGSVDATVALARAAGAVVDEMEWPGSFADARNRALELAGADWTLVLDADEWVETGGEHLRAWCSGSPRLGKVCVHSSYDRPGAAVANEHVPTELSWITRVLPRGARYEGRVHEQVVSPLPRDRIDLHLGHDGYLNAQLSRKQNRNRDLLLADVRDRPNDPYLLYQLGTEFEGASDFRAACDLYARALIGTEASANWRHSLVTRHLHALTQLRRHDDALAFASAEMGTWSDSPDFYFVLGNLALDRALADPAYALDEWLPLASSSWERCLEIGERPDLEGSVRGRGSYLARHNLEALRGHAA